MNSEESHASASTSGPSSSPVWERVREAARILKSADTGALRVLYDKVKAKPVLFRQNGRVLEGNNLWIDTASGNNARIDVFLENPFDPSQKKRILSATLDQPTLEKKRSDKQGVVHAEVGFLRVSFKHGETRYPIVRIELTFGNNPEATWVDHFGISHTPKPLKEFVTLLHRTNLCVYQYVPRGNDSLEKLQNLIKSFAEFSEKYADAREAFQRHFDGLALLQGGEESASPAPPTDEKRPSSKPAKAGPAKKARKA